MIVLKNLQNIQYIGNHLHSKTYYGLTRQKGQGTFYP